MKSTLLLAVILFIASCVPYQVRKPLENVNEIEYFYDYSVDLRDIKDDKFHVELTLDSLTANNDIFNFAATVPGSYSILDIGRFVTSFKAYDTNNIEQPVERISTNKFKFQTPQKVNRIVYDIAETWDTRVDSNNIARMSGSSIESDHILINPHTVFGYIRGLKEKPIRLKLDYSDMWIIGTPAYKRYKNYFFLDNFDDLIHSPFLIGHLTSTRFNKSDINIDIYTFSKNNKLKADQFISLVKDVVSATADFMDRKPVNYYTFLFHFDDKHVGAHEHPSSSVYTFREDDFNTIEPLMSRVIAHEFYHLQIPFYLHEKELQDFNYETPFATDHLWFYEGVTEWAANITLLREGLMDFSQYFYKMSNKINHWQQLKPDKSLLEISRTCYSNNDDYNYIYSKGAIAATLLDIHLLNATNNKTGLREVINRLALNYNSQTPFESEHFIEEFINLSHPSVKQFMDDYILGDKELPVSRYFSSLAIKYEKEHFDDQKRSALGYTIIQDPDSKKMVIIDPDSRALEMGFMEYDTLLVCNGIIPDDNNVDKLIESLKLKTQEKDLAYTAKVKRGKEQIDIKAKTVLMKFKYIFMPMDHKPDMEQISAFKSWSNN